MFNKHFIFLLINFGLCLSKLTISPSDQIVINEGDPLTITCTASEEIDFFIPLYVSDWEYSSVPLFNREHKNGEFKVILNRPTTVVGDTGYYGCVENSKNKLQLNVRFVYVTPETYDEIEIKWTYVYVKSDKTLLTIHNMGYFIDGTIGNDLLIPCRPTSPEHKVILMSQSDNGTTKILPLSKELSFNPRTGFTIHNVKKLGKLKFFCNIQGYNKDHLIVEANVSHPSQKLAMGIYTDTLQQFTLGEKFTMNCSITTSMRFSYPVLYWTTPRKNQPIVRLMKENSKKRHIFINELTIENVTNDDVGEYKCNFYGSGPIQIVKANLQFHTKNYLNVSMKHIEDINGTIVEVGQPLDFWISVSAYPLPTYKWINPKGNEILNHLGHQNYDLNSETFFINLRTRNLTLEDEGNHTLIVTNSARNYTFTVFIGITVKPQISEPTIPFVEVSQGDKVKAECKVIGKPLPTVSWDYMNHFTNLSEKSPTNSLWKINSTNNGGNETISTLELQAHKTEKIICKACNEAGCASSVAKIINIPVSMELIPEVPTTFRNISLNVGDPLTIDCKSFEKITFFYPKFDRIVVTSEENITTSVTDDGYTGRFQRRETVYGDSGWYGCAILPEKYLMPVGSNLPFTPDIYTDSNVQWIYVFLKSTDHLFLDAPHLPEYNGRFYIEGKVGKDAVFPCRPSSPDYTVKLYSGGELANAEFDPKKGMTKNLEINSPANSDCVITLDNGSKKSMNFTVITPDVSHLFKNFQNPKITTKSLTHMEIGKSFKMNCSISLGYNNNLFLAWVIPQTNNHTSQKFNLTPIYSQDEAGIRYVSYELTIKNVTAEDFGFYECRYFKYASIVKTNITLKPHEYKHLKFKMEFVSDSFPQKGKGRPSLQFHFDAYPIPELHWYNLKGKELSIPSEFKDFKVNGEEFIVDLSNSSVTLDDVGMMIFTANNSAKALNMTFNANVNSSIIEDLIGKPHYSLYEIGTFHCRARGYPVPTIYWRFLDNSLNELPVTSNQITELGTKIGEISSTVNVTLTTNGYILCISRNIYGEAVMFSYVTVSEPSNDSTNLKTYRKFRTDLEVDSGKIYSDGLSNNFDESITDSGSKNLDGNNNKFGMESMQPVIKPNKINPYMLGTVNKEIITTEGSTVMMHCSASTDKLPDDIEWFKIIQLLATDGRVIINKTKTSQSYSSQLTILDVTKRDEGDYSCKGTMDDGSTVGNIYHLKVNASAVFSASVILQLSIMLLAYLM